MARDGLRRVRGWALGAALAGIGLIGAVGCQSHQAGMGLPSGKYIGDDPQHFSDRGGNPPGNSRAAYQRARMDAATIPMTAPEGSGIPTF